MSLPSFQVWTKIANADRPDAISHWDDLFKTFRVEQGEWTVKIGRDAQTLEGKAKFTIEEDFEWRGL